MTTDHTPPGFLRRRPWLLFLLSVALGFGVPVFMMSNPQLSFASVHQVYQQGEQWVETPHLGEPAYDYLVAPDEAIWALNSGGLYRWDGESWQNIHTPDAHPTDFALDGETIWLVTHGGIVRCETLTLNCETAQTLNNGLSIAAFDGQVYAITKSGQLVWFDGVGWNKGRLNTLLPDFDAGREELIPKLLFTDDGTLWLSWYHLWRYDGTWSAVTFGEDSTDNVRLTGATPGVLWTKWGNGLVAARPTLDAWQLFTWEEMSAPGEDWIFDLTNAPDGSIWVAAQNGLIHYDGTAWDLQPLPDEPLVTAVAITSDNIIWAQTTASGAWLPLVAVAVGLILFIRWTARALWRSQVAKPAG